MVRNKKKKLAGVTYDKWIGKPKKGLVQIKELKKYENKLIAFLDILGIKGLIEEYRDGNEHIAIDKIEEIRKIIKTSSDIVKRNESKDFDYLHISDSFVYVCDPKSIVRLIELLVTIQMRIINECHFLLRGAVTIGDAITRDDAKFIIGPAYIQAYQLQEDDAIYPRIIVDNSVVKEIKKCKHSIHDYLRQDSDKEYFIDYIKVHMQKESLSKQKIRSKLRSEKIFNFLKDTFDKNYQDERHNISQKYGWTIQYFKELGVWDNG